MEANSHYWLTWAILKECGVQQDIAKKIAWADNMVDWLIPSNARRIKIKNTEMPMPITQNYAYESILDMAWSNRNEWMDMYAQGVWQPFHFVTIDLTNEVVQEIPIEKFFNHFQIQIDPRLDNTRREDLFLLGIALHAWQDTFSHQDFTGFRCDYNEVKPGWRIISKIVPNIGHAEAGSDPDKPFHVWKRRPGDSQPINNKERWLRMIEQMARYFGHTNPIAMKSYTDTKDAKGEAAWEEKIKAIIASDDLKFQEPYDPAKPLEFDTLEKLAEDPIWDFKALRVWASLYYAKEL